MTRISRTALVLAALAFVAAAQEKKVIETYAENNEHGVSIRAPKSPGKDQMWIATSKEGEGGMWSNAAVSVKHRVDKFSVDVVVQHKDPKQPMSGWLKPVEIAKQRRENFTKKEGDQEPNWTDMRVIMEDPKAKIALGSGHMHRIKLTDKNKTEHELTEYVILSSDTLYIVTVAYSKEAFQKYFAREGQVILNSIDRAKVKKTK